MFFEYDFKGSKVRSSIVSQNESAGSASINLFPASSPAAHSGHSNEFSIWLAEFRADSDRPGASQPSSNFEKTPGLVSSGAFDSEDASGTLSGSLLLQASLRFSAFLRDERDRYRPEGRILNENARALYSRFFSQELLDQVRVLVLTGRRLANPSFFAEENDLVAVNLPNLAHKASVTFLDVIVFNERITERELFKALVHATQVHVLGPKAYAEHYVRGVLQSRSYSLAPMQAQAFALAGRFADNPDLPFSVEAEIRSAFNLT